MYSSYHFFNKDKKYDKFAFHETMNFAIDKFMECKALKGDRQCVLDPDLRATISTKVRSIALNSDPCYVPSILTLVLQFIQKYYDELAWTLTHVVFRGLEN